MDNLIMFIYLDFFRALDNMDTTDMYGKRNAEKYTTNLNIHNNVDRRLKPQKF